MANAGFDSFHHSMSNVCSQCQTLFLYAKFCNIYVFSSSLDQFFVLEINCFLLPLISTPDLVVLLGEPIGRVNVCDNFFVLMLQRNHFLSHFLYHCIVECLDERTTLFINLFLSKKMGSIMIFSFRNKVYFNTLYRYLPTSDQYYDRPLFLC